MFARNNPHLIPAIIMAFALGALNPVWSQSISPDVTAAAGDFQQHPAFGSLHWTLGELPPQSETEEDQTPHYGLNYNEFTVVATKAIQEQQTQIETLRAENAVLQAKVSELDALRAEVADIKAMLLEKK